MDFALLANSVKYMAFLEFKPTLYKKMFQHIAAVSNLSWNYNFSDIPIPAVVLHAMKAGFGPSLPHQHDSFLLQFSCSVDTSWTLLLCKKKHAGIDKIML